MVLIHDHGPRVDSGAPDVLFVPGAGNTATDTAIARHLAISERTLRRRLKDLMDELGVDSRFVAGVRAVERGWL